MSIFLVFVLHTMYFYYLSSTYRILLNQHTMHVSRILVYNLLAGDLVIRVWDQEICFFYNVANMMATGGLYGR
jgi:hypothetical protein